MITVKSDYNSSFASPVAYITLVEILIVYLFCS